MPKQNTKSKTNKSIKSRKRELNVFEMLMDDHRKVEDLFEKFESARTKGQRDKLIREILVELCVHAHLEEEHLYPSVKMEDKEMGFEAFEEHHAAKLVMNELTDCSDCEVDVLKAKVKVLSEMIAHHIQEEEEEIFPLMEDADFDMEDVAQKILAEKERLLKKGPDVLIARIQEEVSLGPAGTSQTKHPTQEPEAIEEEEPVPMPRRKAS